MAAFGRIPVIPDVGFSRGSDQPSAVDISGSPRCSSEDQSDDTRGPAAFGYWAIASSWLPEVHTSSIPCWPAW